MSSRETNTLNRKHSLGGSRGFRGWAQRVGWTLMLVTTSLVGAEAPVFPRWLAIGNSITLHGPNEPLGWRGKSRGMAASEVETDYVHQLRAKLQAQAPGNAMDFKVVGRLGKLSGGTMEQIATVVEQLKAWKADLVTIQLGENDRFKEIGRDGFEQRYRLLVDSLLMSSKRPVIVCTGVWNIEQGADTDDPTRYASGSESAIKDEIIAKICAEKGLLFVKLASAANDPANHGFGETSGVKWHPNDAGMQEYAERIFDALYPKAGGAK